MQRQANDRQVEIVAAYKGSDPIDQAIAMALASDQQFSRLDSRTDGNIITLCMNGCGKGK